MSKSSHSFKNKIKITNKNDKAKIQIKNHISEKSLILENCGLKSKVYKKIVKNCVIQPSVEDTGIPGVKTIVDSSSESDEEVKKKVKAYKEHLEEKEKKKDAVF